jgi:hypothetical protein
LVFFVFFFFFLGGVMGGGGGAPPPPPPPAAPTNSYFIDGKRMAAGKQGNINAVQRACTAIDADAFIPFASQAEFHRADTEWANRYKVRFQDLEAAWRCRTRLLPPYSRVDLATDESDAPDPIKSPSRRPPIAAKLAEQTRIDAQASWGTKDSALLEQRFRAIRVPLLLLFPRGFSIKAGDTVLFWDALKARLSPTSRRGHFQLSVPLSPLMEALLHGHLGDLCIPMFAEIELLEGTKRDHVNYFFMLLILQDYGYVGSWRGTMDWLRWAVAHSLATQLPLPVPG